jgi:microcompartment protein CcmL/EutN
MDEAVALAELGSIATGLATVDALTKRAVVTVWATGVVEPGRYVIVLTGPLADVQEAWDAAQRRAGSAWLDGVLIAHAHPGLQAGLTGARVVPEDADCVGVVEGRTLAGVVDACDRALKDADVSLAGLRLQPGLGGRAYFAVIGAQHDVEAALEVASARLGSRLHQVELIARPTPELLHALLQPGMLTVREG